MIKTSGYSGTSLAKKLGLKSNFRARLINQPGYYFNLFEDLPDGIRVNEDNNEKVDFIHFFTKDAKELSSEIKKLKNRILQNGMIWISWPKKSSGITSDITEDLIRESALKNGLVDVKVCAVDETWSGLKLVIPVKERK